MKTEEEIKEQIKILKAWVKNYANQKNYRAAAAEQDNILTLEWVLEKE